jgi:apolipoprotein N-acyltransferase
MARRLFFTILSLILAVAAFSGADPTPDVNLFGVLFLFFAFVAWFHWKEIQAGYAYHAERGEKTSAAIPLMVVRLGPMLIRELVVRKRRRA